MNAPDTLQLDERRRAMLLEIGIRVWQPALPEAAPDIAIQTIAKKQDATSAKHVFHADSAGGGPAPVAIAAAPDRPPGVRRMPVAALGPAPGPAALPTAAPGHDAPVAAPPQWQIGAAQPLYAEAAQAGAPVWLVLAEAPAGSADRPAFGGDAGRLLDNMLRAARLHQAGAVVFAPLLRSSGPDGSDSLPAALASLLARVQPDIVLVMGRLAAQAVLQSTQPLGRLRGQVHALVGTPVLATYDADYLLRMPECKAAAWEDMCLALHTAASSQGPQRRAFLQSAHDFS